MDIRNNIRIVQDEEIIRILELQKLFKAGEIKEKDLSSEDIIKLKTLYNNKINQLKYSIQNYKNKIVKIKNSK